MTRTELEAKNKTDLIALGATLGFALTPATSKNDMVNQLLGMAPAPADPSIQPDTAPMAAPVDMTKDGEPVLPATIVRDNGKGLPALGKLRTLQGQMVPTDKVKIKILATDTEHGDVKLSLNGHMLQIKRGVVVEIERAYLGVLNDSIVQTYSQNTETNVKTPMEIQRYPYQIVG